MENKESQQDSTNPALAAGNHSEDEIDLLELWMILWKRKKFIGIVFIAAVVISAIISFLMTPVYKSSVTVIPLTASSNASPLLNAAANFLPISLPHNSGTDKILAVLHSRTIREMVVKDLNLTPVFIKNKKEKDKLIRSSVILKNLVTISYDKNLDTITVSVQNKNPELAQKIASAYIVELDKILNKKALTMSKMNVVFLKKQLKQTKIKIAGTMSGISLIQRKYGLTLPPVSGGKNIASFYSIFQNGGNEFSSLLIRLNFLRAKYAALEKMYEGAQYKAIKHNLYVQVLDKPVIPYMPFKPDKKLIVAVAGISSLFLSVFLVFLVNYIDNVKKTRIKPE